MALQMNDYTAGIMVELPDPDRIPVKAVREAVAKLADRLTKLREANARTRDADAALARARNAVETAGDAAAEAESGGPVNAKKLVKALRSAEDAYTEALIESKARISAAGKAQRDMVDVIEKHTPAWHDAALKSADRAVLKLAAARRSAETAAAELDESLGVLGMLGRIPLDRKPVMLPVGESGMHSSRAIEELGASIKSAVHSFDTLRGAAGATVDVEVPMPGEDVVPDPAGAPTHPDALGELTIGADDE